MIYGVLSSMDAQIGPLTPGALREDAKKAVANGVDPGAVIGDVDQRSSVKFAAHTAFSGAS